MWYHPVSDWQTWQQNWQGEESDRRRDLCSSTKQSCEKHLENNSSYSFSLPLSPVVYPFMVPAPSSFKAQFWSLNAFLQLLNWEDLFSLILSLTHTLFSFNEQFSTFHKTPSSPLLTVNLYYLLFCIYLKLPSNVLPEFHVSSDGLKEREVQLGFTAVSSCLLFYLECYVSFSLMVDYVSSMFYNKVIMPLTWFCFCRMAI